MDDIRRLRIGTLINLLDTKNKMYRKAEKKAKEKDVRKATQADIDAFLGR